MAARFYSREDYLKVLCGGPWVVMGYYLAISKRRPNFDLSENKVHTILVWVRVLKLHLEMFNEASLTRLGNTIGKIIRIDIVTEEVARGKYARICVELDLNKPLQSKMMVMGKLSPIEYEGLHRICFHCGKFGYNTENCPNLKPATVTTPQDELGDSGSRLKDDRGVDTHS